MTVESTDRNVARPDWADRFAPSTEGRMFMYLWHETTNPGECKFGERWVKPGDDPWQSVLARVKESVGVRKDLVYTGVVQIDAAWDVNEYAQQVGRAYQGARMDDYLRQFVGHRKGTTGEIHTITSDELILRLNNHLSSIGQPLPSAALSTMQYRMAEEVIASFAGGNKVVLAELCARFGKTLFSGAVARELEIPLVVVASYVKTVFASFGKDLTSFAQWQQYAHVDTQDKLYKAQLNESLQKNQPAVAYLSMCPGAQREARSKYLFSRRVPRLLIVDEADFGVHRNGQAELLKNALKPNDRVLIMTGTNADRATKLWNVDTIVSVTYPELLVQKVVAEKELGIAHA